MQLTTMSRCKSSSRTSGSSTVNYMVTRFDRCKPGCLDVRRAKLIVAILSLYLWAHVGSAADVASAYHFRVMKGRGVAVCDAFLKRLNLAHYQTPPQCGIPESHSIPGFSELHKVPLSRNEAAQLWPHVFYFTLDQHQFGHMKSEELSSDIGFLDNGMWAWRYDPPISLNNSGAPDNVLMWQGVSTLASGQCGDQVFLAGKLTLNTPPRYGYVLTPDSQQIDEQKTKELFGHPGAPPGTPSVPATYEPLGPFEDIFEYQGQYFLDTFYVQGWGDIDGQRTDDPAIDKVLAVFLRAKGGVTQQVCEYRMTGRAPNDNP